jgi:hypothetical protein
MGLQKCGYGYECVCKWALGALVLVEKVGGAQCRFFNIFLAFPNCVMLVGLLHSKFGV